MVSRSAGGDGGDTQVMDPLVEPPQISIADARSKLDDSTFLALAAESLITLPAWITPITERVQQLHPLPGSRFDSGISVGQLG